jgi:hypothetical protein
MVRFSAAPSPGTIIRELHNQWGERYIAGLWAPQVSLFSQRFIEIHIVRLEVRGYANKISVIGAENVVMTWRGGE